LARVEDRKADTLLGVLNEHLLPGSIVYSDMWKAYNQMDNILGLEHLTSITLKILKIQLQESTRIQLKVYGMESSWESVLEAETKEILTDILWNLFGEKKQGTSMEIGTKCFKRNSL
jgi:hypothetical protein